MGRPASLEVGLLATRATAFGSKAYLDGLNLDDDGVKLVEGGTCKGSRGAKHLCGKIRSDRDDFDMRLLW
ncbi:OLC1v1002413C1 [Oldenlandia corymbosa var. corymbosa]|uniref:OLC1v1002413C1 n=1 Tax=Oldenlandia corymbosa var. corymbosa TaxID=529605 RepID=A0AAV1D7K5_OLDCO|nr:OLC1v1002413C1 [Oldenlandia corymbosa var. corymbosa]